MKYEIKIKVDFETKEDNKVSNREQQILEAIMGQVRQQITEMINYEESGKNYTINILDAEIRVKKY